jgi:hypothetical protein
MKGIQRMAEWLPTNDVETRVVQRWLQWRYMSPHKTTQQVFFCRHHRYSAWQMKAWFSLLSPKWLTDTENGATTRQQRGNLQRTN